MADTTSLAPTTTAPATSTATPQALSFMNGETYNVSKAGTGTVATAANAKATGALNDLGVSQYTGYVAPKASTTTISNQNKIDSVPSITAKTDQLAKTGITTDANGNATYANGTVVPTPDNGTAGTAGTATKYATTPTNNLSTPGISQGGYIGDVYYAAGSPLPLGQDGKPLPTTQSSPTDDKINANLDSLKSQSDSLTASVIDSIHANYERLRKAQEQVNKAQEAGVNTALLMGGVTGKGSSSQYAPISSAGITQAQVSYGLSLIADLNSKEASAVTAAQQAGLQNDFQLMDKKNAQISKIRDEKVAAANKINDQIAAQAQKLADEKLAADKDSAIASLYKQGITDPAQIVKTLTGQGMVITSGEVASTLKNIGPDLEKEKFEYEKQQDTLQQQLDNQHRLESVAKEAAQFGADQATIQNINNAKSVGEALAAAGNYLSADFKNKVKQQEFDNSIQLQQVALSRANLAISKAHLGIAQQELDLKKAAATAGVDPNQLMAYAQQYASNGQIPSGIPDGSFGVISNVAKALPKPNGTLVDNNTGVKPNIPASSQEAISALYDVVKNKIPELLSSYNAIDKSPLGKLGSSVYVTQDRQDFRTTRDEILNLLLKARSGAAVSEPEYKRYLALLPGELSLTGQSNKIDSLSKDLNDSLNSQLKTNGLSIYGYSNVDLNGNKYTVGDIITNGQQKARVNPDGSLTEVKE